MKAKQLIKELKKIVKEHGDVDCKVLGYNPYWDDTPCSFQIVYAVYFSSLSFI